MRCLDCTSRTPRYAAVVFSISSSSRRGLLNFENIHTNKLPRKSLFLVEAKYTLAIGGGKMEDGGFTIVAKGSKRCAHGNRGPLSARAALVLYKAHARTNHQTTCNNNHDRWNKPQTQAKGRATAHPRQLLLVLTMPLLRTPRAL